MNNKIQDIINEPLIKVDEETYSMQQALELIGLINKCLNTIDRMNKTIDRIEHQQDTTD